MPARGALHMQVYCYRRNAYTEAVRLHQDTIKLVSSQLFQVLDFKSLCTGPLHKKLCKLGKEKLIMAIAAVGWHKFGLAS